jgi:hypothetical protein
MATVNKSARTTRHEDVLKDRTTIQGKLNRFFHSLLYYVYGKDVQLESIALVTSGQDLTVMLESLKDAPVALINKSASKTKPAEGKLISKESTASNDKESTATNDKDSHMDTDKDNGNKRVRDDEEEDIEEQSILEDTPSGFNVVPMKRFLGKRSVESVHPGLPDAYITPKDCIVPLINKFFSATALTILDPFAGEGVIVDAFEEAKHTVHGIDQVGKYSLTEGEYDFRKIDELKDLLGLCKIEKVSAIVCNAPFSIKYEVLDKLLRWGISFSVLMPVAMMSTKRYKELMEKHNKVIDVALNVPAPTFKIKGKNVQVGQVGWFVYGLPRKKEETTTRVFLLNE